MNFLISRYVDALSARNIWFKIHIKLYSVVYTVGARMGCHIAHFVTAPNAEWKFHFPSTLDTLHHARTAAFILLFMWKATKKSLKRHKNKNCYLIWEMWDKLNFHNEVFLFFLFLLYFYTHPDFPTKNHILTMEQASGREGDSRMTFRKVIAQLSTQIHSWTWTRQNFVHQANMKFLF